MNSYTSLCDLLSPTPQNKPEQVSTDQSKLDKIEPQVSSNQIYTSSNWLMTNTLDKVELMGKKTLHSNVDIHIYMKV